MERFFTKRISHFWVCQWGPTLPSGTEVLSATSLVITVWPFLSPSYLWSLSLYVPPRNNSWRPQARRLSYSEWTWLRAPQWGFKRPPVPLCLLINTLNNFKETELLGRVHNGGDEPENSGYNLKHICSSNSLHIIWHQKILWQESLGRNPETNGSLF